MKLILKAGPCGELPRPGDLRERMSIAGRAGLLAVITTVFVCPIARGDANLESPRDVAEFALAGLKDGRAKLRSGLYRAHGSLDRSAEPVDPVAGPIEIFSAFDAEHGLLRFDRTEPMWVSSGPSSTKKLQQFGGKFVSTPDMLIRLMSGEHFGEIRSGSLDAVKVIRAFDVRIVGLSTWGTSDSLIALNEVVASYRKFTLLSATVGPNNIYTLRWVDKHSNTRTELQLDGSKDFVPVRFELRSGGKANGSDEWATLLDTSTVSWTRVNDVWVPKTWRQEDRADPARTRDLRFDWEAVNAPVDRSLFTPEGLDAKDTIFVDRRFGEPVLTRVSSGAPGEGHAAPQRRRRLLFIVAANVGLLAVALGMWVWRRRRRNVARVEVGHESHGS